MILARRDGVNIQSGHLEVLITAFATLNMHPTKRATPQTRLNQSTPLWCTLTVVLCITAFSSLSIVSSKLYSGADRADGFERRHASIFLHGRASLMSKALSHHMPRVAVLPHALTESPLRELQQDVPHATTELSNIASRIAFVGNRPPASDNWNAVPPLQPHYPSESAHTPLRRQQRFAKPVTAEQPLHAVSGSPVQQPGASVPPVLVDPLSPNPTPRTSAPPHTEAAGERVGATAPPLLIIGIPTVGRAGDADYLMRTLEFIETQVRERRLRGAATDASSPPTADADASHGAVLADGSTGWHHAMDVRVLVMDNGHGRPHPVFERAKSRWCPDAACTSSTVAGHTLLRPTWDVSQPPPYEPLPATEPIVWFATNSHPVVAMAAAPDEGNPNVPGSRVRQQTHDVVQLLTLAHAAHAAGAFGAVEGGVPASEAYYMFQEDDFRLCPRGIDSLAYGIAMASRLFGPPPPWPFSPASAAATAPLGTAATLGLGWNALRVSFGLNGLLLPLADLPTLAAYYTQHVARRPPDHMVVEWYAGETAQSAIQKAGRPHVAFRYNLLEHFGRSSSLRSDVAPVYAFCFDEMDGGVVFDVEAYRRDVCGHTDVHPCRRDDRLPPLPPSLPPLTSGIPFSELAANARADSLQTWAPHPPPKRR